MDPASATPLYATNITPGETSTLVPKWNETALRTDLLGHYGGGAFAIASGGELSEGTGLTLNMAAAAWLGGLLYKAASTLALTDAGYNFVYLTSGKTLSKIWQAAATPVPSLPALSTFLGRVLCAGGVITEIDYSGRFSLIGDTLLRQTADYGVPGDAPTSAMRFRTKTAGGSYDWDGAQYLRVWENVALQKESIAAGEAVVVPSGYQAGMFRQLTILGHLEVYGHFQVRE